MKPDRSSNPIISGTTFLIAVVAAFACLVTTAFARYWISQYHNGGIQNSPGTAEAIPPHIIMIMVDDLGWNGLSLHGKNDEVKNPTLERLARKGILLQNYYVYKFCAPSRASFLTGRVPGHGIWEQNPSDTAQVGVNLKAKMIPAVLKEHANYSTHQIGKWHQGFYAPHYTPLGRGFDTSFGFYMGGSDHFTSCQACPNNIPPPDFANHSITCPANYKRSSGCNLTCPQEGGIDLFRDNRPAIGENGTYTAYLWSKEAVRVIEGNANRNSKAIRNNHPIQPLFLYLALHNVHQPVEAPPEFLEQYPASDYNETTIPRRYYNSMVFSVDLVIANVTKALKRTGMYNNSIIVISTDNGGTFEHSGAVPGSSNYPLRGYKYSYYEGGVRGFAMVVSPLLPKRLHGTTSRALLSIYDWYTTFCGLAGISNLDGVDELAEVAPLDGVDAWKVLTEENEDPERPPSRWVDRGGPGRNEALLGVGHGKEGALRSGDMKLIVGNAGMDGWSAQYPGSTETRHTRPESDAVCHQERPCLFNITNDPTEEHNLADSLPYLTQKLADRYAELSHAMNVLNGYEDQLATLVWDGSYHVPRTTNGDACEVVRKTGFWLPWKAFPHDGPPETFPEELVLI
ncbi:sulfatase [Nitzschia inconspicua]|uniref:Sulfatase n=1 Tax=Nitzschia inconspicua TaxID=303405 RepID=A0A9K3KK40_9STRA|nr:sulfatase [Nitzschia inconspicua]